VFSNEMSQCYYNNLGLSGSDKVDIGNFISPVIDLAINRDITELSYVGTDLLNYNILYRTADEGGIWGNWINENQNNPIPLTINKRYFQYMFTIENAGISNNFAIDSTKLDFNATTVSGNLNGTFNWIIENSPV